MLTSVKLINVPTKFSVRLKPLTRQKLLLSALVSVPYVIAEIDCS